MDFCVVVYPLSTSINRKYNVMLICMCLPRLPARPVRGRVGIQHGVRSRWQERERGRVVEMIRKTDVADRLAWASHYHTRPWRCGRPR